MSFEDMAFQSAHETDEMKKSFKLFKSAANSTSDLNSLVVESNKCFSLMARSPGSGFPDLCPIATAGPVSAVPITDSERVWKIYECNGRRGLYVLRSVLSYKSQAELMAKCVNTYPNPPNVSNADLHCGVHSDRSELLNKLRWVTLGYHYDWNRKLYNKIDVSAFPAELATIVKTIADAFGWSDFQPEAGIVNYYTRKSTLSAHTDHSELDLTQPLFSISLGLSCLFLIGGLTKDIPPVPVLLQSGDVVVMSGPSRLAYHSVPRIIEYSTPRDLISSLEVVDDSVREYSETHRINVSIRQVLAPRQSFAE